METETLAKVIVSAKIENVIDLYEASRGQIADDPVRRVEVADAMVDTGATLLAMPKRMIEQPGYPADWHRSRQDNGGAVDIRDLRAGAADDPGSLLFGGCDGVRGGVSSAYRLRSSGATRLCCESERSILDR